MATDASTLALEHDAYVRRVSDLSVRLFGSEPTLELEYDLSSIALDERIQVRYDKNNAPREMVDRYVWQMSEHRFPPPVCTQDKVIVDGNTRMHARRKREDKFSAMLVLPVDGRDVDDDTAERLMFLGQALNSVNGKPLDKKEQRDMVRHSIALGMTTAEIQGAAGVKPATINAVRAEVAAEDKLLRVGLPIDSVRDASLRALGKAADLNDQPFAEVAQLATDAGFNAHEIGALASTVRELGSDNLALERITAERDANAIRIAARREGDDGHPPASRQLRQKLGFINARPASSFVETNRDVMADYLGDLRQAVEILNETIVLQEAKLAEAAA